MKAMKILPLLAAGLLLAACGSNNATTAARLRRHSSQ